MGLPVKCIERSQVIFLKKIVHVFGFATSVDPDVMPLQKRSISTGYSLFTKVPIYGISDVKGVTKKIIFGGMTGLM